MCYWQDSCLGSDLSHSIINPLHWTQFKVHLGPETIPYSPEHAYCLWRLLFYPWKFGTQTYKIQNVLPIVCQWFIHCITSLHLCTWTKNNENVKVPECESKLKCAPLPLPFKNSSKRNTQIHENLTYYSKRKQTWEAWERNRERNWVIRKKTAAKQWWDFSH